MIKLSKLIIKIIITLLICFILGFWVKNEFNKYLKIEDKIEAKIFNNLMPRSYDEFAAAVKSNIQIDPRVLDSHIAYYEKIIERFPFLRQTYSMLGYCYYQQGNLPKATALYSQVYQQMPNNIISNYNLGALLYKQGMYQPALKVLENSLIADPKETFVFVKTSQIIYPPLLKEMGGDNINKYITDSIMTAYLRSIRLIALISVENNDYESVNKISMLGFRTDPDYSWFYNYVLGLANAQMKNYNKAIYFLKTSLDQEGKNPSAYEALMKNFFAINQRELATQILVQYKNIKELDDPVKSLKNELDLLSF